MASAVEVWVLWGLAALQIATAYWWYRGPSLPGTRFWGAGLLLLNGLATLMTSILLLLELSSDSLTGTVGGLIDRWSDLFLLGIGVVALGPSRWGRLAGLIALVVAGASLAIITPSHFTGGEATQPTPFVLLRELPLLLAVTLAGPAVLRVAKHAGAPQDWPWVLVMSVLALRFSELSTHHFVGRLLSSGLSGDGWVLANHVLALVAFLPLVVAFGGLVLLRYRADTNLARTQLGFVSGLILAGFVFGAAQHGITAPATMLLLTLGLARPLGFLAAQSRLTGEGFLGSRQWRDTVAVGAVFVVALIGVNIAAGPWGLSTARVLLVGGASAVLALPVGLGVRRWIDAQGAKPAPAPATPEASQLARLEEIPRWPLQPDRVTLPPDWQDRVERAFAEYQRLPSSVATRLAEMPRWQRLVLALDALPDGGPPFPYEASTPGLHLTTHCPYASIGPVIAQANERYKLILDELGIVAPPAVVQGSRGLVRETFGRAEGLRSGRVKTYSLTPLGRLVAARLRTTIGLNGASPAEAARLVGEGFGRISASTPATSNST